MKILLPTIKKGCTTKQPFLLSENETLLVPKWIAPAKPYVALQVHPERYEKVDDNWAPKSEKRKINEIEADAGGGNAEFFTQVGANAEGIVLDQFTQIFHG